MSAKLQREISDLTKTAQQRIFAFVWSRHFITILALGQFLSFCITSTSVASTKLFLEYGFSAPTTQNSFTYFALAIVYTSYTLYKYGWRDYKDMFIKRGWKYFILSIFDVEGNYFIVKAFSYTSLLTIILLDAWAIPVVMVLSYSFLKVKYHWSQFLGGLICIGSVGVLVAGDLIMRKDEVTAYPNAAKGIAFCLISATCYGISNFLEETLCRQRPIYEVVGQMGVMGTIINTIQMAILERKELEETKWSSEQAGLILAYTIAMFALYSGAPILFRWSSATFFNLSLQTSDFYSLLFGLFLFDLKMHALYPLSFAFSIIGITVYNIYPATLPKATTEEEDKYSKKITTLEEGDGDGRNDRDDRNEKDGSNRQVME